MGFNCLIRIRLRNRQEQFYVLLFNDFLVCPRKTICTAER